MYVSIYLCIYVCISLSLNKIYIYIYIHIKGGIPQGRGNPRRIGLEGSRSADPSTKHLDMLRAIRLLGDTIVLF